MKKTKAGFRIPVAHMGVSLIILAQLSLPKIVSFWAGYAQANRDLETPGTTFVVNTTADTVDADVGMAACADLNGKCSLRAAIMQANFTPGADVISLPAGLYQLTRAGSDDADVLGDLDITDNLTIQGAGSGVTIIDGNGSVTGDRVIQIFTSAAQTSLSGLTIRNGKRMQTFDEGGGLYWEGSGSHLTLTNVLIDSNISYYGGGLYLNYSNLGDRVDLNQVVIHANTASASAGGLGVSFGDLAQFQLLNSQVYSNTAYEGGGVYFQGTPSAGLTSVQIENSQVYTNKAGLSAGFENHSGSAAVPVILTGSHFFNNHADFYGGAVGNYGALSILSTRLDGNAALEKGGGIYEYEGGWLNILQTTLSANSAKFGGGLFSELFIHNASKITLTNSTLSGNTTSRDGAGIYAQGGEIKIYNTTIANNKISVPDGTTYNGQGGGVFINIPAILRVENTLLADNSHRYGTQAVVQDDCFGTLDLLGYDLVETTTSCTFSGTTVGLISGQDPKLGVLRFNDGPTQTQALLLGSPAIDAGQGAYCMDANGSAITIDQRGFRRPIGVKCDIGAVEYSPYALYTSLIRK